MNRIASILAAGLFVICSANTFATIQVGEQAKLTYKTVDGKTIDIEKLHGKIVVVDFWATWCGPCMAEADHMVAMNAKYAPKGLVMLGISLDQDKAKMIAVAKEKNFTWPQYFDGKVWQNDLWAKWGSNGIPFTVLIDPNGKVVYAGHPANLEPVLELTFKSTPPFMVDPKIVADAMATLDQVDAKIDAKEPKAAIKLLGKIPAAAKGDEAFASRDKDVLKKLEDAGEAMLAEVDPLVSAGNFSEAVARLRDLSDGLAGTPAGVKAKKQLSDLSAKPEVKAAMAKAEKDARDKEQETHAADALAAALKLQEQKKDEQAYSSFKAVVKDFPNTAAATKAGEQVKAYDQKNPAVAQKANEAAAGSNARAALSLAASYERIGRIDSAKEKYQSIMAQYPGTSFAKTAEEHLALLP